VDVDEVKGSIRSPARTTRRRCALFFSAGSIGPRFGVKLVVLITGELLKTVQVRPEFLRTFEIAFRSPVRSLGAPDHALVHVDRVRVIIV